jgi:hypothetical protein
MSNHARGTLDHARDELYRQIHRCGALAASPEQREDWLRDTLGYLEEQYPDLSADEVAELRQLGERFFQPAIPHGKGYTALTRESWEEEREAEAESPTSQGA